MKLKYFSLLILSLLLISCGWAKERVFLEKDHGQNFIVNQGQIFKIELPSNITTGFEWNFDNLDPEYFRVIDSGYSAHQPMQPGSGGQSWWRIKALKPGSSRINLLYYRRWEGRQKAGRKFLLKLIIR